MGIREEAIETVTEKAREPTHPGKSKEARVVECKALGGGQRERRQRMPIMRTR